MPPISHRSLAPSAQSKHSTFSSLVRSLGNVAATLGTGRRRRRNQRWNCRRARVEPLEARTLLDADCFRISEYMTVNRSTILDADGDASDWIEIQNTCPTSADLAGWKLSDGESYPWTFSNLSLAGNGYFFVFASGKNRTTTNELHTNFSLENDTLTLTAPNGTVVSSFATVSNSQVADFSYGIASSGTNAYLAQATPGQVNTLGLTGLLAPPKIVTLCGGAVISEVDFDVFVDDHCSQDVTVALSSPDTTATILYTTDGSEPGLDNPESRVYTSPIPVFARTGPTSTVTLVDASSTVKAYVPTTDELDPSGLNSVAGSWLDPSFDDSDWASGTMGVGYYDTLQVADSLSDFAGVQGMHGWRYGYWNKGTDADGSYAVGDFISTLSYNASQNKWRASDAVLVEINSYGGRPAGFTTAYAPVRRYIAEYSGHVRVDGTLADLNPAGDGVVATIYHNGIPAFSTPLNANEQNYSVDLVVATGDLLDFLIDPGTSNDDSGDETRFTARVRSLAGPREVPPAFVNDIGLDVEEEMLSVASGAYLRIPFNVDDPSILESDPGNDDAGGLVAYWDFEDGPGSSVLRDRSGNGWHGTLVNMDPATDWIAGRVGATALEFDGVNDFVSTLALANDLGIDGNAARTIAGWVKGPPSLQARLGAVFEIGSGLGEFSYRTANLSGTTWELRRSSFVPLQISYPSPDSWYHVAVVCDGANTIIYINGVVRAQVPGTINTGGELALNMGVRSATNTFFRGAIDDLAVWDLALSNDEVTSLVNGAAPPFVAHPVDLENELRLRIRYDDGLVAYLNGRELVSFQAPPSTLFNSAATVRHDVSPSGAYETLYLGPASKWLVPGPNVLQIHGLNLHAGDADFFVSSILDVVSGSSALSGPVAPLRVATIHPDKVDSATVTRTFATRTAVAAQAEIDRGVVGPDDQFGDRYASRFFDSLDALPTVMLSAQPTDLYGPTGIYTNYFERGRGWERPVNVEFHDDSYFSSFNLGAGLRVDGTGDAALDKKTLRLRFRSDYGSNDLPYSVFGDGETGFEELVLVAAADDSWQSPFVDDAVHATYLRNELLRRTARDTGLIVPRSRYVHLYLNGAYWGLYQLVEQIDEDFASDALRLGNSCADDLGCVDILEDGSNGAAEVVAGDRAAWNSLMQIVARGIATNEDYETIGQWVDIDAFIDYLLVHFYAGATDWLPSNWRAIRGRYPGGRFKFVVGHSEGGFRSLQEDMTDISGDDSPAALFEFLRSNARFRWRFADRAYRLLSEGNALSAAQGAARLSPLADEVREALVAEAARWGDARRDVAFTPDFEWQREIDWLRDDYLPQRADVVRDQLRRQSLYLDVSPPQLSSHGGTVFDDYQLEMFSKEGVIYYTLDGSDPREAANPMLDPGVASEYVVPVTVSGSMRVRAAAYARGAWSPLAEANFGSIMDSSHPALQVSEIMYNPSEAFGGRDNYEFIELTNTSSAPVQLLGLRFTEGVSFVFANPFVATLAPGEFVVVVKDREAFESRYGQGTARIAGEFGGQLSNGGERLRMETPVGEEVFDFAYDDAWYLETDGIGRSLVKRDVCLSETSWGYRDAWASSFEVLGTPGRAETYPADVDGDGVATLEDLAILQANLGLQNATWEQGDLDGDRSVNRRDASILADYFGAMFFDPDAATCVPTSSSFLPPPTLTARPGESQNSVALTWTQFDDDYVSSYNVYRSGMLIGVAPPFSGPYIDLGVSAVFVHEYQVSSVDNSGRESPPSNPVSIVPLETLSALATDSNHVIVSFSTAVEPATASNPANYHIDGTTVVSATMGIDGQSVILTTHTLAFSHLYRLHVTNVLSDKSWPIATNNEVRFSWGDIPFEQTPPVPVEVSLAGSAWTAPFYQSLATNGLGSAGVAIWNYGQQIASELPWSDIDIVHARFSEPVTVGAGDIRVSGVDVGHYDVASFSYDPRSRTATWQLRRPIGVDRVDIEFTGATRDQSGNLLVVPDVVSLRMLAGDVDGDSRVNRQDVAAVVSAQFASTSSPEYDPHVDVDGNGLIDVRDVIIIRNHFGAILPSRDVVISEFMALNDGGLADEDGDFADWIELHNVGLSPVDLGGWFLTDNANNLARWRLPDVSLAPGERKVVYASGKDRQIAEAELHTDFGLSSLGGFLALVLPDGETIASEYHYEQQYANVSYGRNAVGERERYYAATTPGGPNPPENTVLVTEFMASNHVTLADEDGDYADWIEVYNAGPTAEHMTGWTLSDGGAAWPFAPINLSAGEYRVIFASGNDRRDPEGELHATFRLSRAGEDVILTSPFGVATTPFNAYPEQRDDVAFGLSADFAQRRYFTDPTPGEANLTGFDGVLFSVPHGFYDEPFAVELSSEVLDAVIRYTTDGSTPTASHGIVYTEGLPVFVDQTTTLRAVANDANAAHVVTTQTYVFLDNVLGQSGEGLPDTWGVFADYGMDPDFVAQITPDVWKQEVFRSLPSLSLVMNWDDLFLDERGIYAHPQMEGPAWERPGSLERIDTTAAGLGFSTNGTVRIVGQPHTRVSEHMVAQPKLSFGVRFDAPVSLSVSGDRLFAASPATQLSSIYLRAGFEDSWTGSDYEQWLRALYGRDQWMRETQRDMGQPAVDGRFVHLYINGLYWGVYNATEAPSGEFAAEQYGGDPAEFDIVASSTTGIQALAGDPTLAAWDHLTKLASADLSDASAYAALSAFVDIDNLIDYLMLDLYAYAGSTDVSIATKDPRRGWFAVRRRSDGERFQFFAWDNEVILGEGLEDYLQDRVVSQEDSTAIGALDPYVLLDVLRRNAEFVHRFADRAQLHLSDSGALSAEAATQRWIRIAEILAPTTSTAPSASASPPAPLAPYSPLQGEGARWGRHRRGFGGADSWETRPPDPNANPPPPLPPPPPGGFGQEDSFQRDQQLRERGTVLLGQLRNAGLAVPLPAPRFTLQPTSIAGSPPAASPSNSRADGLILTLTTSTGAVYYTLDGSDPRLAGGGISPLARLYTSPVLVGRNVLLTTRAHSGNQWSAVVVTPLIVETAVPLRITEVMYHPSDPSASSPYTDDDFEFLELTNVGTEAISLLGMRFVEGIDFDFAQSRITTLAPQQRVVLVKNADAFTSRYDTATIQIAGEYGGLMNNGDDDLRIVDAFGQTVVQLSYRDAWYPLTDGPGFSLVVLGVESLPAELSPRNAWLDRLAVGQYFGGTPGAAETVSPGAVVISEVYASATNDDAQGDWIELANTTDSDVDVGGWYLSDNAGALDKFTIPIGTILAAHSHVVFFQVDARPGYALGFGLKQSGDDVFLTSADGNGNFGGHREQISFGSSAAGHSLGRYVNTDGAVDFVPLSVRTPGAGNAAPQIGMIVISELMYGPFSTVGAPMEFIELVNNGDQPVPLDGWSLGDGVDYYFGAGLTLVPGGTILVSGGAPSEFRTQYAVVGVTQVVGPFSGRLNNGGERVALYDSTGTLVDQVNYGNESPWPMLADEYGATLERRSETGYGNESRNWKVSPRGGTPGTVHAAETDSPQSFPYLATFDGGDLFSLPGWILRVSNPLESDDVSHAATWSLSAAGGAAGGQMVLAGTQSRDGSAMQDAILSLDLTTVAGATDLVLDFQLRRDGTPSTSNFAQLYVSGDGIQWQPAGSSLAPPAMQWWHYVADLDTLLADAAVVADGDVFLRFRHHGAVAGDGISLDDVRVSTLDLVGPQVIGFSPAASVSAPVGQVTLMFDEIVDAATLSPADVAIIGPTGEAIGVSIVHSADGRTWTVEFPSQQISGVYAVRVGPDVRDTFGNAMGSSASIGGGAFHGQFQLAAATASTPYSESFDATSFVDLSGWSFAVENGSWQLATPADSSSLGWELRTEARASGVIAGSSFDAILKLDVSNQSPVAPLGLQFDLWRSSTQGADDGTAMLWVSGDGSDWRFVEGLTTYTDATNPGSSGTITPYGFDLAHILSQAEVAWDTDVWLRFSFTTTSQASMFALDNVRINALDVTGPQVVEWSADDQSAVPLSHIDVTFDVPVDAATFTAAQVRVRDPFGAFATPQSITSVDGQTWTIAFTPQTVAGSYQVSLLPGVRDLTGIALNQDGDSVAGEAGDAFVGSFSIGPAQAMTVPHEETFDFADSGLLTGWSIFADPRGQWRLSAEHAPWQGDRHFVAETIAAGLGTSVQEATLRLDLSAMAGADEVYFEVWAKQIGSGSLANVSRLFISGDGDHWYWIAEFAPPANRYTHYAFEVDELARQHAIAVDGDMYFRFQHQAERVGDGLAIDGLRVGQGDASGPRIAAYGDVTLADGVATIDVTFDRPIDANSFQPEDVLIYIGQREVSEDVNVSASAIVARDDRTFTIVFTPPALGGAYTLSISPEIVDLSGVPLNQNADAVAASLAGDDQFSTVFVMDHPGQTVPYLQDFESGSFADLSGWSFRVMGDFEYGANTWEFSDQSVLGGDHDLVATQLWDCWTDHEAILKLDLTDQVGATDLELDFWLQFLPRENPSIRDRRSARVFLRGDSDEPWIDVSFWLDLNGELKPPEGTYTRYAVDLDAVLAAHDISFDNDVYIMFNRRGFHKRSAIALDNIGVRRTGDAPTPAATSKLTPLRAAAPDAIAQLALAVGENRRANTLAHQQDMEPRRQPVLVAERLGAGQPRARRVAVRLAAEAAHDRAIAAWLRE